MLIASLRIETGSHKESILQFRGNRALKRAFQFSSGPKMLFDLSKMLICNEEICLRSAAECQKVKGLLDLLKVKLDIVF